MLFKLKKLKKLKKKENEKDIIRKLDYIREKTYDLDSDLTRSKILNELYRRRLTLQ